MASKNIGKKLNPVTGLTDRQERFCQEYVIDLDAEKAARRAGYAEKSAFISGKNGLQNIAVIRRIEQLQAERNKTSKVTAEWVIERLQEIAGADLVEAHDEEGKLLPIHQMPRHVTRSLSSVDLYKDFTEGVEVGETKRIKMHDKMKALELLGKHFKLYTDKFEVEGTLGLAERLEKARGKK